MLSGMALKSLYTGSGGGSEKRKPNEDQRDSLNEPAGDTRKGVPQNGSPGSDGGLASGSVAAAVSSLEPDYIEDQFGAPVGPLPSVSSKIN